MRYLMTCAFGMCLASAAFAATPGSVQPWDTDLAGWEQSTTISTVLHAASGGNPDGRVSIRNVVNGSGSPVGIALDPFDDATGDFTGDYAGVAGVSVDLRFETGNFSDAWVRFRPDAVDNGWHYSLTNVFPANVWNTYTAPLNPNWDDATAELNGWQKGDPTVGSFASLFDDVGWAEVRLFTPEESTLASIDNFRLIAVPEPGTALIVAGTALAFGSFLRRRRH